MITSKNNFPFALHKYYGYKIFDTLSKKKKLLIVLLASSITPSLPPSTPRRLLLQSHNEMDPPLPHRTLQSQGA